MSLHKDDGKWVEIHDLGFDPSFDFMDTQPE